MEIPYSKLHTFKEWPGLGAAEFARLDSVEVFGSTKKEFGLSIARQAVRKNMGRIRIEPVENMGTRVVLSLPLYKEGGE